MKLPALVPAAVDSPTLSPPTVVNERDVKSVVVFPQGGGRTKFLLTEGNAGCRYVNMGLFMADPGRFGTALETPGTGSFWHTHPLEIGEEDLFYTIRGTGTMVYLQAGKVHSFEFHEGDAIHSHHLTNFTTNHTDADLVMVYAGAPHPPGTIVHTLA